MVQPQEKDDEPEIIIFAVPPSTENELPTEETGCNNNIVADFTPIEPGFPGGEDSLQAFLNSNIVVPTNSNGTAYVQFIVCSDGSLSNPRIIRSVNPEADREILRVVNLMPLWSPGMLDDSTTVNVRYTLPVRIVSP